MKRQDFFNNIEHSHISSGETTCLTVEYEKWEKLYTESSPNEIAAYLSDYEEELLEKLEVLFALINSNYHSILKRFLREKWNGPNHLSEARKAKLQENIWKIYDDEKQVKATEKNMERLLDFLSIEYEKYFEQNSILWRQREKEEWRDYIKKLLNQLVNLAEERENENNLEKRWSYEDILENPRKFFDAIARIRIIPSYQYVLNYIMLEMKIAIGEKNQQGLWTYIEEWKERENWEEQFLISKKEKERFFDLLKREEEEQIQSFGAEQYRLCIGTIFLCLRERFLLNGRRKFEMEDLKNLVFHFTKKALKDLAFGMKMDYQDYELFRIKVLKLTRINFFDRADIFIYLVLKYAKECKKEMNYDNAERCLRKLYPVSEKKSEYLDDKTTKGLRNELEEELEENGRLKEKYREKIFSESIDIIKKELEWIDGVAAEQKQRSSKRKLEEYIKNIRKKLEQDKKEIYLSDRKKRKSDRRSQRKREKIEKEENIFVQFSYPVQKKFFIPAGTILKGKTKPKMERMEEEVRFVTKEDVILPRKEWIEIEVPVRAISSDEKMDEFFANSQAGRKLQRAVGKAKKNARPVFLSQNSLETASENKIIVLDERLQNNIKNIRIKGGVRLFCPKEGVKNEGSFALECKWNENILPHTKFEIWIEGYRFEYETIGHVNICKQRVDVKLLEVNGRRDFKKEEKEESKKNPEKEMAVSMLEKTEGVYDILLKRYTKKKEYLEFSCRRGMGVLLKKDEEILLKNENGDKFLYKILEDVISDDRMESEKIAVKWENIEEIREKYREKNSRFHEREKWEVIPTRTIFSTSIHSNTYQAFNPKPIYLWNREYHNIAEDEEEKDGIRDTEILLYFYQSSYWDANDYQGVTSYGKDYLLNTDLFKSTRITLNSLHEFVGESEKSRNQILTLGFLEYILENEEADELEMEEDEKKIKDRRERGGKKKEERNKFEMAEILQDFDYQVAKVLERLGYMSFYFGNAYDAFIYLLLCSDFPLDIFQNLWSDKHPMTQYIITYTPDWQERLTDEWRLIEMEEGEEIELERWQTSTNEKHIFSMPKLDEKKEYILFHERNGKERKSILVKQEESQEVSIVLKEGKLQIWKEKRKS